MISAKKTAKMQRLIILKQLWKILVVRIYPILRYFMTFRKEDGFFNKDDINSLTDLMIDVSASVEDQGSAGGRVYVVGVPLAQRQQADGTVINIT